MLPYSIVAVLAFYSFLTASGAKPGRLDSVLVDYVERYPDAFWGRLVSPFLAAGIGRLVFGVLVDWVIGDSADVWVIVGSPVLK